jgi:hypothetical protein
MDGAALVLDRFTEELTIKRAVGNEQIFGSALSQNSTN